MFRFLKALIAAKRLMTLGGNIQGEIPVVAVHQEGNQQFVDLPLNADTAPDGLQSMFWNSRKGHSLVLPTTSTVPNLRRYLVVRNYGPPPTVGVMIWLSGWIGETPADFRLSDVEEIQMPNGTRAYLKRAGHKWVIHVHGRNASRAETLRNFQTIDELGFSQIALSLESDPPPAGLGLRKSHLGTKEWTQVESAIKFAYQNGAEQVTLLGFSLGAMIIGQCLQNSVIAQSVKALVFDSPLIDFTTTLDLQASKAGEEPGFAEYGLRKIAKSQLFKFLGLGLTEIPTLVKPLGRKMLVFYSPTDGYVSMEKIPEMKRLNPQARFEIFEGGRHCRLYNQEPERYSKLLVEFLRSLDT